MAFQIMRNTGSSFSPLHSIFCCFHGDGDERDKYVVVCSSLSQLSPLTLRLPYVITSLNTMAEDGEIRTQKSVAALHIHCDMLAADPSES